jgi:nicotinamide-nucleotide amidase
VTDPLVELAGRLQAACVAGGVTVATAESCTGGLVAHLVTEVPGSSAYLRGGVVAYADDAKRDLLGVPPDVLAAHARFGTDLAAAVTGVAGPDGGTAAKPVGLVYVAVASASAPVVRRFTWTGDRTSNKRSSAAAALELLLEAAGGTVTPSTTSADARRTTSGVDR